MLLEYAPTQKRIKAAGIGKPQRTAGGMVRVTSGLVSVGPKIHRKVIRAASKRPAALHRAPVAVKREQVLVDPCENSSDSGLGFDHHIDYHPPLAHQPLVHHPLPITHQAHTATTATAHPLCFGDKEAVWQTEEPQEIKRRRLEIKLESDDANDNFTFPETVRAPHPHLPPRPPPRAVCSVGLREGGRGRTVPQVTLGSQLPSATQDSSAQLVIVCQPETQHRARYQTEGSRGAVKDRTGNGFPIVKLVGYDRPAVLQVFIGTDQGRVAPHMFYQACRVSGKNSTPCVEKKVDGTIVIEIEIEPSKDMIVTCDCVGILKERNVDVEHRFPEERSSRSKKKSTRCRMVFRTSLSNPDGTQEILQVTSQPIVCTQPPGVPEICKKSLVSCGARGGQELFILGKNFLKDTRVVFSEGEPATWAQSMAPDKEFLQQSHLVCLVPAYRRTNISEPVNVQLVVESSGKASEPHTFTYLPDISPETDDNSVLAHEETATNRSVVASGSIAGMIQPMAPPPLIISPEPSSSALPFIQAHTSPTNADEKVQPMMWDKRINMIPPPPPSAVPISAMISITRRRPSIQMIIPEPLPPENLKREVHESTEARKPAESATDLSNSQNPSMETFHRFVTNGCLPSINVSTFLSNIEGKNELDNKVVKTEGMNEVPRIIIPIGTDKIVYSGGSSNLLTTIETSLASQPVSMPFVNRNMPVDSGENLGVIVNPLLNQKNISSLQISQDIQPHQLSTSQSIGGLDILISSSVNKPTSATEKLDALVNSAAESHISSTPTSPIESPVMTPISEVAVNVTDDSKKMSEQIISPIVPMSVATMTSNTSNVSGTSTDGSLSSLLNPSPSLSNQQVNNIHSPAENIINSQNPIGSQSNLLLSPQMAVNQVVFSDLQSSVALQLESQSSTSHLMQSSSHNSPNTNQPMSSVHAPVCQELSPQSIGSVQSSNSCLNHIMQSSPQDLTSEQQNFQTLQLSMDQPLPSQNLNSTAINNCSLNDLIQSSQQNVRSETQTISNLQVLEQLSPSAGKSAAIIQTEHVQQSNLSMNNMVSVEPMTHASITDVQSYSTMQRTIECHVSNQAHQEQMRINSESVESNNLNMKCLNSSPLNTANSIQALSDLQALQGMTSQVVTSAQSNQHLMIDSGDLGLNSLSASVSTSQIQAAVQSVQALSELQASLNQFTAHVVSSAQPMLDSITANSLSSSNNVLESTLEAPPQICGIQAQTLSDIQISLGQLAVQSLSSVQTSHDSFTSNNSMKHSPSESITNQEVLSSFRSTLEEHISPKHMETTKNDLIMRTPVQENHQSPNESMSNLQVSLGHVLNPAEALVSNNTPSVEAHGLCLSSTVSPESIQSTSSPLNIPMVLSPTLHRSPVSLEVDTTLNTSSILSSVSTGSNLTINSSNSELSSNIVLQPQQNLMSTSLSMNNASNFSLTQTDLQIGSSQRSSAPPNSINQFGQVSSDVSAAQVGMMNNLEQRQESKKLDRKEETARFIMCSGSIVSQSQPVKKVEEGMPVPNELAQMSETDLISYINPSCFDTV